MTDRISVQVQKVAEFESAFAGFRDYICSEILAESFEIKDAIEGGTTIEINDFR